MNYSNLLTPINSAYETTLFGQKAFNRRLTQQELWDYEDDMARLRAGDKPGYDTSIRGIQLVLSALVNEDGSRPDPKDLPAAAEFLSTHSNKDLLEANVTVQRYAYGDLEAAEKN